MGIRH
ncbi:hypothetical protein ECEC1864_1727, partial [Escherichia coli EC1864]